jgi:hypothetical protein
MIPTIRDGRPNDGSGDRHKPSGTPGLPGRSKVFNLAALCSNSGKKDGRIWHPISQPRKMPGDGCANNSADVRNSGATDETEGADHLSQRVTYGLTLQKLTVLDVSCTGV